VRNGTSRYSVELGGEAAGDRCCGSTVVVLSAATLKPEIVICSRKCIVAIASKEIGIHRRLTSPKCMVIGTPVIQKEGILASIPSSFCRCSGAGIRVFVILLLPVGQRFLQMEGNPADQGVQHRFVYLPFRNRHRSDPVSRGRRAGRMPVGNTTLARTPRHSCGSARGMPILVLERYEGQVTAPTVTNS
jgi:hypothetical protein